MARAATKKKPAKAGMKFVREEGGIKEYRLLKNGLRVLLVPNPAVPVAGCMVTYHVGSRNEAIGYTGATHLLEHLMFKGSKRFNKENRKTVWELLESKGALVNATTWFDRTNYYEVVPSQHLPDAIAFEADRMRTARILEADRQSEMPVVRNEFERDENLPIEALDKQIWALAYQAHPYHHSTIGWKSDIEGVSIERLNEFYNDFYHPDNATVTIVGEFDERQTLKLIEKEFGRHMPATRPVPPLYTEEPPQEGERRVTVRRAGTNMVGIAHKIPNALHEDMPALLMLSTILSDGKTSRLYHALTDTALATDATTYCYELHDPGLFITYVTLTPKTSHEKAEEVVRRVYDRLKHENVKAAELSRTRRLLRSQLAQRRDGPYMQLATLNEAIATGDWSYFVRMPELLMKVTAADIKRVARTYLVDDQSTVGWFVNTSE